MGRIYCVMGKSASGKDTIYKRLLGSTKLDLRELVSYTTRPIRAKEVDGREYHFTDEAGYEKLKAAGKVIESRVYDTVHGPWRYFTTEEGIEPEKNYLLIATVEQFTALRDHFGEDRVRAVYIELDDGDRLQRALYREKKQSEPKYAEMCRRFLADNEDFAEDKLTKEKIVNRFENVDIDACVANIETFILRDESGN